MTDVNTDIPENVINAANNITSKVKEINSKINSKVAIEEGVNVINEQINEINVQNNTNIPVIRDINVNKKNLFEEKGILDPGGKANNPLTGEPYLNLYKDGKDNRTYSEFGDIWSGLPVYKQKDEMIQSLYDNQCLLVTAGTGSGKTVLVPKYLLHVLNYQGKIAITIPRISATISGADFSAKTLDTELGDKVGYAAGGERVMGPNTKLVYATDGYILEKLKRDPNLEEYDALIIDEAHERNPNIDLILMFIKNVLRNRPKFKFVIMSATINPQLFLDYYKEFGMKYIEGFADPPKEITEIFLPKGKEIYKVMNDEIINKDYQNKTVEIIMKEIIIPGKPGDILAILPGKGDLTECCRLLDMAIKDEKKKNPDFTEKPFCVELKSSSERINLRNAKEKNYALGKKDYKNWDEGYTRRIIMATEVAEAAITLEGDHLLWMIDSGLSNQNIYYPKEDVSSLEKKYISKASHLQRKGRVGRKVPGTCYNLFTEAEYKKFPDYSTPKILLEDFIKYLIYFFNMPGVTHADLPFSYSKNNKNDDSSLNSFLGKMISPIGKEYVSSAIERFYLIGAIKVDSDRKGYLTPLGTAIGRFRDIDPLKAASVIEAFNYRVGNEVSEVMALMEELDSKTQDLFIDPKIKGSRNSPDVKAAMKEYESVVSKLISPYGAYITFYKILKTYKEKKYNIRWERGREVLESKETDAASVWAREHYINAKKLNDALKLSKDINRSLGSVIGNYMRDREPSENKLYLFRDTPPIVHPKIEDNIMQAVTAGHVTNVVRNVGRDRYRTCFPEIQTIGEPDRFGIFKKYVKVKPKTCVYSKYTKIMGMKKFMALSKVPVKVSDSLRLDQKEILKKCDKVDFDIGRGDKPKGRSKSKKSKKGKKGKKKKWRKK